MSGQSKPGDGSPRFVVICPLWRNENDYEDHMMIIHEAKNKAFLIVAFVIVETCAFLKARWPYCHVANFRIGQPSRYKHGNAQSVDVLMLTPEMNERIIMSLAH
jgi:hypothetical protein